MAEISYVLKIQYIQKPVETRTISAPVITIGRDEGDIILSDDQASGRHAEIRLANGKVVVHDLGSTNGILVNGTRKDEVVLGPGQTFVCGQTPMTVMAIHGARPALGGGRTMIAMGAPPGRPGLGLPPLGLGLPPIGGKRQPRAGAPGLFAAPGAKRQGMPPIGGAPEEAPEEAPIGGAPEEAPEGQMPSSQGRQLPPMGMPPMGGAPMGGAPGASGAGEESGAPEASGAGEESGAPEASGTGEESGAPEASDTSGESGAEESSLLASVESSPIKVSAPDADDGPDHPGAGLLSQGPLEALESAPSAEVEGTESEPVAAEATPGGETAAAEATPGSETAAAEAASAGGPAEAEAEVPESASAEAEAGVPESASESASAEDEAEAKVPEPAAAEGTSGSEGTSDSDQVAAGEALLVPPPTARSGPSPLVLGAVLVLVLGAGAYFMFFAP